MPSCAPAAAPAPTAAAPVINVVAAETRKKGRTAVASTASLGWSHVPVASKPAAIVTPPPHPQLPTEQHRPGSPESSRKAGVATLGRTTFGATTSLPGMAPPASNGAIPMGVRSFLRHGLPDPPVAVSLAALAAVALPAVGVLVILTLAGVRVGYRQAKAGFAVRTAGIARFARPGAVPLGVVRSGSVVVIRPRALPVVRPGALSAGPLLDNVA